MCSEIHKIDVNLRCVMMSLRFREQKGRSIHSTSQYFTTLSLAQTKALLDYTYS